MTARSPPVLVPPTPLTANDDVDYDRIACPFVSACLPVINGTVVFRDNYHLSNQWLMGHRDELWALLRKTAAFG